jgi:DNA (cytosine-5)-methyltransferase 1
MAKSAKGEQVREVWSFFTGGMGLDLGLEQAGLIPTLANEIDRRCCETLRENRPTLLLIEESIETLTGDKLRKLRGNPKDVFLMVGGPPCQSFSSGGKRSALSDPRGNLIFEFLRLISEVRPQNFIFENVANLATAAVLHRPISERPGKHWSLKKYAGKSVASTDGNLPLSEDELSGSALRKILEVVSKLGYHINFGVLDAADYGAPQHRLRFVILGSRDQPAPNLPVPTHGYNIAPFVTVKDAIWKMRREPGSGSQYTPDVRRFFELVPSGGNWRSLPKDIQREALGGSYEAGGGKTGFYRRLAWDRPAPTITGRANRKGSALCHPDADRPLSVRECAALQGFPDDWHFSGAMNSQYQQIGNAVPVHLGKALGETIQQQRRPIKVKITANFDLMFEVAVERLRASARNKRPIKREVAA